MAPAMSSLSDFAVINYQHGLRSRGRSGKQLRSELPAALQLGSRGRVEDLAIWTALYSTPDQICCIVGLCCEKERLQSASAFASSPAGFYVHASGNFYGQLTAPKPS